MKIMNSQFPSIEQAASQYLKDNGSSGKVSQSDGRSFAELLELEQLTQDDTVKFSKHATGRLSDRNIELSDNQLDRLNAGMQKASAKGINESLVLMDQLAFIVNVRNNTVITAMDQTEAKESVFTNIDGAVIV